jgi:serine/threonine protein kinase
MPFFTPEERLGTRVGGKYDLLRICGRGGMGVLFEGVHARTGRRVAVKFLHPRSDAGEESVARFLREARTATAVRHPNVVDMLDVDSDGLQPFIVMDYLEGESLEELLRRERCLAPASCLPLLLPILEAVSVAHDRGIVHRDIKPANIFLARDDAGRVVPKLLDFGVAKAADVEGITEDGTVLGTPGYMSPEQAQGHPVGPASDIWAMGVVLYRCLAGVLPFEGASSAHVLMNVLTNRTRPLCEFDVELPVSLCSAIEHALLPEPAHRYADMRTFARALRDAAGVTAHVPSERASPASFVARPADVDGATLSVELDISRSHLARPSVHAGTLRRWGRVLGTPHAALMCASAAAAIVALAFFAKRPLSPVVDAQRRKAVAASSRPESTASTSVLASSTETDSRIAKPMTTSDIAPSPRRALPAKRAVARLKIGATNTPSVPKIRTEW